MWAVVLKRGNDRSVRLKRPWKDRDFEIDIVSNFWHKECNRVAKPVRNMFYKIMRCRSVFDYQNKHRITKCSITG
ncbi:MAG: hypothetical protein ACLUOI_21480 [Eisenbergiella sp.]